MQYHRITWRKWRQGSLIPNPALPDEHLKLFGCTQRCVLLCGVFQSQVTLLPTDICQHTMSRSILHGKFLRCEAARIAGHAEARVGGRSLPRRRAYASESGDGKTFKGQLYDSTHQRLQREKADQVRYAQIRGAQRNTGGSPIWVVPLGKHNHWIIIIVRGSLLCSTVDRRNRRLHVRSPDPICSADHIHGTTCNHTGPQAQYCSHQPRSCMGGFPRHCWSRKRLN